MDAEKQLKDADIVKAELLVKSIKIPAQPKAVLAITKEMQRPDPNFKTISRLISEDLALSAKVLRVVNSPFYGLPRRVDSIQHAFTLLGLRTFHRVILTGVLHDLLVSKGDKAHMEALEQFWSYSLIVAKIAEFLAVRNPSYINIVSGDHAYLAGLFHDCAVPLFIGKHGDYQEKIAIVKQANGQIFAFEEQSYGGNHGAIGYLMAKSWQLPDPICQAIRFHHQFRLESQDIDEMAVLDVLPVFEILRLASFLGEGVLISKGFELACCYASDEEFLQHVNMTPSELSALRQEVVDCVSLNTQF
ncbi:MAG: HDOD domain-containing protein [Magnetococcales bacterium]|nr:HDOD domain-containing protein [Magnetococcales bacterium]